MSKLGGTSSETGPSEDGPTVVDAQDGRIDFPLVCKVRPKKSVSAIGNHPPKPREIGHLDRLHRSAVHEALAEVLYTSQVPSFRSVRVEDPPIIGREPGYRARTINVCADLWGEYRLPELPYLLLNSSHRIGVQMRHRKADYRLVAHPYIIAERGSPAPRLYARPRPILGAPLV